jgi:CRP-like cAMP-binding protein
MLVERGAVRISTISEAGDRTTVAVRGAGSLIGDHAALTEGERNADVVALERTEVSVMSAMAFRDFVLSHPTYLLDQVRRLIGLVAELNVRLATTSTESVDARVRRVLADLAGSTPGEQPVLSITQLDLAGLAGCSRAGVSNAIAALRAEGAVSAERGRIQVIDRAGLLVEPAT